VITAPSSGDTGSTGGNSTFNQTLTDLLYWRLDGTNDPPSADWDMDSNSLYWINSRITPIDANSLNIVTPSDLQVNADDFNVLSGNGQIVGSNSAGSILASTAGGLPGSISFGNTADIGISQDGVIGTYDYDGGMIFKQKTSDPDEIGEFIFIEEAGDWRFALPKSGADYGTYNPRSMIIAGASVNNASNFLCSYWGFGNIDCDTSGTGADLGVQDDLQVLGDVYVDGNLSSSDGQIYIAPANNITFPDVSNNGISCIRWFNVLGIGNEASICQIASQNLDIISNVIRLGGTSLKLGTGNEATVGLDFDVSGTDADFDWDGSYFLFNRPVGWVIGTSPVIIPSTSFPSSNITFNNILGSQGFINNINLNISSGNDICITGGNCLSSIVGGDTFNNITNNITFVERPLISITTTADSSLSAAEYNAFDEDNYASFSYVNNTAWDNVTYYSSTGQFQVHSAGRWKINPLLYTRVNSASVEADMIIQVNGAGVFDHVVARPHGSVDPELMEVSIIYDLEANDNVTVLIDSTAANTLSVNDGSTMNMILLDSPVTDTGGGGQNYLSIQATGTGNTVAEPANPFASTNYTGYGFHNFADSGTITYDSTLGVFTVPTTDQYKIEVDADGSAASGYTFGRLNIYINGVLNKTSISQTFDSSGEEEWGTSASAIISLNANDNITVGLLGHSGSPSCPCSFNIGEFNGISINNI
jgi:hypothetical protein